MSVQQAKERMDGAWTTLQDAQREYARASDAWLDAVAESARGVASARSGVSERAACGYTRVENGEPLEWTQCAECQNIRWVGTVTGKCGWCYEQHKEETPEKRVGGAKGATSERVTANQIRETFPAEYPCWRDGTYTPHPACACLQCERARRGSEEKRVEDIGPHTSAGKVEGMQHCHGWTCLPGCPRHAQPATHRATNNAQVLGNKGPVTTSHG